MSIYSHVIYDSETVMLYFVNKYGNNEIIKINHKDMNLIKESFINISKSVVFKNLLPTIRQYQQSGFTHEKIVELL